ncbi:Glycosyl hydrolases family 16 [Geosmithia morbida]|uniref:Crh-like protein n=1 Tax=Geosmithia morbida TaxID=1094350 RepID=A0A9P4YQD8_9HYPO|nr:Glycosyl hydrolases family 16 [Geosmithia morbida]KAF4119803.1 Glycosyl hydrolases family 16 [Geosmithia morbida]
MWKSLALAALVGTTSVLAAKCDVDSKCPKETPCCSQYGECGVGAYCLGGCNPRSSFSLDACAPEPVCEDRELKFDTDENIQSINKYLGDPSKADWVASGEPALHGDNVLLTMAKNSVGTVLSSTVYMWYGNAKARLKTSRGRGVVTAFILFSDVQDEIDFEWIGVDLETVQTNYYNLGYLDYENSANITVSDSFANFHDYEVRWTPDQIEWLVDGEVGRTIKRVDTWNETAQRWDYPQTPARVQLSLWPGGLASNAKGTIDWAGGEIDWDNAADMKDPGYYYATLESVSIECYDGKNGLGTNSGKSYTYNDEAGTNKTVVDGDKSTILGSMSATGLDMDKGKKSGDDDLKSVPGGSTGNAGSSDDDDDDDSGSSDDNSGSSDSGTSEAPAGYDSSKFDQGLSDDSGDGNSGGGKSSASALAMVIAGCALYWL